MTHTVVVVLTGDPYLENWNHFTELGINMHHLNTQAREREGKSTDGSEIKTCEKC